MKKYEWYDFIKLEEYESDKETAEDTLMRIKEVYDKLGLKTKYVKFDKVVGVQSIGSLISLAMGQMKMPFGDPLSIKIKSVKHLLKNVKFNNVHVR